MRASWSEQDAIARMETDISRPFEPLGEELARRLGVTADSVLDHLVDRDEAHTRAPACDPVQSLRGRRPCRRSSELDIHHMGIGYATRFGAAP